VSNTKSETDKLREATATREQLTQEFRGVTPESSLPVVENGKRVSSAQVHQPSARELKLYQDGNIKVCGNCKFFDLESGRREMIRQRFPERLVKEQEWKIHHLGAKLDELGLCGASGGSTATGFMSKACDQYREKR
jgi:hypothetical protein